MTSAADNPTSRAVSTSCCHVVWSSARYSGTCRVRDVDRFKRLVSVCSIPGISDTNAELVKRGLAVAYREYSMDYVDGEDVARAARTGMWAGKFDWPWGTAQQEVGTMSIANGGETPRHQAWKLRRLRVTKKPIIQGETVVCR